jgi:site-specific DNA-methyltransferase (adenine-specific)
MKKSGTQTSSFGAPKRESHDASAFYDSRLYEGLRGDQKIPYTENRVPPEALGKVHCKSAVHMDELPDSSVHLMVTSPPYNANKDYDEDLSLTEYLSMLRQVWQETYRVLVPGGRACINVANLGRKPYIPLHSFIIMDMLSLGFLMRGEIIWNKSASAGSSTAWGSWQSASNPALRDVHEYILVFSKDTFRRDNPEKRENSIGRDAFLNWTKSVWDIQTVSARKIGHPAPFPVELPQRLIELYTFAGEIILDPFMGSGSTALAALANGRDFVGYDIDPDYVRLAEERIAAAHP